jgi:GTP cyclohydrolase II
MVEHQAQLVAATLTAERMADDLRRQLGVCIEVGETCLLALPVECCDEDVLQQMQSAGSVQLVLTGARARQLGLLPEGNLPQPPLCFDVSGVSLAQLAALALPEKTTQSPVRDVAPADEAQILAILLAKQAGMVPAVLTVSCKEIPVAFAHWAVTKISLLRLWARSPLVDVLPIAQANLPIQGAEQAVLHSFRSRYGSSVHLALVVGDVSKAQAPLVRVHSSCVTGDILGSLRCDCGDQLRLALDTIRAEGAGVLIYLHQEGRGIGIGNKLRAYQLQEHGMDTYDANLSLGFEEDERDFSLAAAILKQLSISRIRLLTNNPGKITALKASGIVVEGRVPVVALSGKHNHDYLKAKADKTGHLF